MGSDDLFKKRRAERKKRAFEYKNPKANSYLIVTEGCATSKLIEKRRMSGYCPGEVKSSEYDPGTTVHLLVEELLKYLEE